VNDLQFLLFQFIPVPNEVRVFHICRILGDWRDVSAHVNFEPYESRPTFISLPSRFYFHIAYLKSDLRGSMPRETGVRQSNACPGTATTTSFSLVFARQQMAAPFYAFKPKDAMGKEFDFSTLKGKVVLVVK
jgi:hypothetical protein